MDAIAGEVLTTITGMAGATKAVAEVIKTLKTRIKGNPEAERAVSDVLDQILSLRSGMLDLQEKVLRLQQELASSQSENVNLREEIRREKERTTDLKQFERKQVGRATVMVRQDEPGIYYCSTCYSQHKIIPLQGLSDDFKELATHRCSVCDTTFQTRR